MEAFFSKVGEGGGVLTLLGEVSCNIHCLRLSWVANLTWKSLLLMWFWRFRGEFSSSRQKNVLSAFNLYFSICGTAKRLFNAKKVVVYPMSVVHAKEGWHHNG